MRWSRITLVSVALFGLVAVASATDGYRNDFTTLPPELETWHQLGTPPATVGPPYLATIELRSAVAADVSYGAGYSHLDLGRQATSSGGLALGGAPVDVTDGVLSFNFRFDTTASPPGPGPMVAWFRLYAGTWDPVNSKWDFVNRTSYYFDTPVNGGWTDAKLNVMEPDEYYNSTPFDWTSIYRIRVDYVWWDPVLYSPARLAMDLIDIEKGAAPIADAGPDQNLTTPGCGPIEVSLTSAGSIAGAGSRANAVIIAWEWKEGETVLSTDPNPKVYLGPGVHNVKLKITCDDGLWDTDTVKITVTGPNLLKLPVDIPMTEQINYHPTGDPAWDAITFSDGCFGISFSPDGTKVNLYGGGWYFGPYVALDKACYETPIDVTAANMRLKFMARYNQENSTNPYADAPINVRFRDIDGEHGSIVPWLYGPQPDPRWPAWQQIDTPIDIKPYDPGDPFWTSQNFDGTKVRQIEYYGTDWAGVSFDYIEIKDLWLGVPGPPACPGDFDCDGDRDFDDIDPFVEALSTGQCKCPNFANCDPNGDGKIDFNDIDAFIPLIGVPCP